MHVKVLWMAIKYVLFIRHLSIERGWWISSNSTLSQERKNVCFNFCCLPANRPNQKKNYASKHLLFDLRATENQLNCFHFANTLSVWFLYSVFEHMECFARQITCINKFVRIVHKNPKKNNIYIKWFALCLYLFKNIYIIAAMKNSQ